MTLNEVIKVVDGKTDLNSEENIKEIKTDTRKIEDGDLFIALKGINYNGEDFVKDAIKNGAIACITTQYINDKCIVVDDTIDTLFKLGNYFRNQYNIPLIAITGSNGKTTTKELLSHILSSKYKVLKNEESKNNIIGVSDTLFKLNNNYDIIVMELGTNHIGEISYLSKMCAPNEAIITNIGTSHLGNFKKRKNIFKEKFSIKDGMKEKKIIINGDSKYLKKLNYYKCGEGYNNDLVAYDIVETKNNIKFNIFIDKEYEIVFNNPGRHFIVDILLAIKVSLDYGIDIKEIIYKISTFKLIDRRMNVIKNGNNVVIDDCYNASYESIEGGINYLKSINSDKILILGDILELGKYSKKIHKKINKLVKRLNNAQIYTVGEFSKYINGIHFSDSESLINYLKENKVYNSYIYIKGSHRMNLDKVVKYFTK